MGASANPCSAAVPGSLLTTMPAFSGVVFWYLHAKREASRIVAPLPRVLHTRLALPHRAFVNMQSHGAMLGSEGVVLGAGGHLCEMDCGPSCTFRAAPTPWPVPWR